MATATAIFEGVNLALAMMEASALILGKLSERQTQREAEGREITRADVSTLMADGDVKAALEKVELLKAKAAEDASSG